MRFAPIFLVALLGIHPATAEEPTIESLALKVEALENELESLRNQFAASRREAQTDGPEAKAQDETVIHVLADGSLRVSGESMAEAEVAKMLETVVAQSPNPSLRIRANKDTKFQDIVGVIGLCRRKGIEDISFATEKAAAPPAEVSESEGTDK